MLDLSVNSSVENKYSIHPVKSTITPYIKHKQESTTHAHYHLGDRPVNITQSFSHLGQERTVGRKTPNINLLIKLARNTSYALLRAGLHGSNGLNPKASNKIIKAYIIPKLLYGLEAARLNKGEMEQLEVFYTGILWSVQGLTDHLASEAIYLLLGNISLEGQLHIRCLILYGTITRMKGYTLHSLAMCQLAIKDSGSQSLFVWLGKVADIYGIDLHATLSSPWPKHQWKQYVNNTVTTHWFYKLLISVSDKSSLRWISHASLKLGQCHPIWNTCPKSVYQIQAATIRTRLLTGRYRGPNLSKTR